MRAARLVEELLMMPGGAVKFTPAWQLGFPVRLSSRWVVESLSQPRSNASSNPVGTWLSLVEHSLGVRGVGSSNLPVPTNTHSIRAHSCRARYLVRFSTLQTRARG